MASQFEVEIALLFISERHFEAMISLYIKITTHDKCLLKRNYSTEPTFNHSFKSELYDPQTKKVALI